MATLTATPTATLTIRAGETLPSGPIVAVDVPAEEYMARYAEDFHEWLRGVVIKISPESLRHALIIKYVTNLLDAYFELNPSGQALNAPFVMRLKTTGSFREPDVQVILNDNPHELTDTAMIGPADICIEVVSPESAARDYGNKQIEYEQAGVREYWIIDPIRQRCRFNRLDDTGTFRDIQPDDGERYHTPLLPRLALHIPTLWQDELPGISATVQAVQAMFND
ncbi:MAG: Uma2 family endonuclease [Anaerolineae bacterium]|nr:Uma2 family endonuclease [Anaerolineae bacterium]